MTGPLMHMPEGTSHPAPTVGFEARPRSRAAEHVGSSNPPATSPTVESLRALDWLNFLLAALLMGFGPFAGLYLADQGWMPATVGLVLTVAGLAGLLTQVPAGELIDIVKSKRVLVGAGIAAVTVGTLILGLRPDFPSVFAAAVMQGMAGSVIGPGIAAISLGLLATMRWLPGSAAISNSPLSAVLRLPE